MSFRGIVMQHEEYLIRAFPINKDMDDMKWMAAAKYYRVRELRRKCGAVRSRLEDCTYAIQ
jgi:hypothetical protein